MYKFVFFSLTVFFIVSCQVKNKSNEVKQETDFSFIFMTDIHLKPEAGAPKAFMMAIDTANKLNADFVITGGDQVFDVMRGNLPRADSLFQLYRKCIESFNMPVYNTVGNHDLYGIYEEGGISPSDPDFKYGMFRRYFGEPYYSFDHKGWHFIVLNDLDINKERSYISVIGEDQIAWLKNDLSKVDSKTPIVVSLHIPMFSAFSDVFEENISSPRPTVSNRHEVMRIFENHNLKLVLQGHLHWLEDIYINGKTHFITGGAVSGFSWKGVRFIEEGFLLFKVKGNDFTWEYIDYGWDVPVPAVR